MITAMLVHQNPVCFLIIVSSFIRLFSQFLTELYTTLITYKLLPSMVHIGNQLTS